MFSAFYSTYIHWRKFCFSFLILSGGLLTHVHASVADTYSDLMRQGERFEESGDYLEASSCYKAVLKEMQEHPELEMKAAIIRHHLAKTYFLAGQFEEVVQVLLPTSASAPPESLFLLAVAQRRLGQNDQAVQQLNRFLSLSKAEPSIHYLEAQWELAAAYFSLGQWSHSRTLLESLLKEGEGRLLSLTKIYLVRLELAANNHERAEIRLKELATSLPKEDLLCYEMNYLYGKLYLQQSKYDRAMEFFAKALPENNRKPCAWEADLLYEWGYCCLKKGEQTQQKVDFDQAEALFKKLHSTEKKERSLLALAECYLQKGIFTKDPFYLTQVGALLNEEHRLIQGDKGRVQAALIQAKALDSPESYFHAFQLLDLAVKDPKEKNRNTYLLQQGLVASQIGQQEANEHFLGVAEQSWNRLIAEFPKEDTTAQALYSLATLSFQKGQYSEAEKGYLRVVDEFPSSPLAGEALFFASVAVELQRKGEQEVQSLRKRVWEEFPNSFYAGEAYLRYYPYMDYLKGHPKASEHLLAMPARFPQSPHTIQGYYLIGLYYKKEQKSLENRLVKKRNLPKIIEAFQNAETLFDQLFALGKIPSEQTEYFIIIRYRSILERALANMTVAMESKGAKRQVYLEYASELLRELVKSLEATEAGYAQLLVQNESYHSLREESSYSLVQAYLKEGKEKEADKLLSHMLENYEGAKITRGYYLSRVWYEKAALALQHQRIDEALASFERAEDAAKGNLLNSDQKLDIWIQQSLCYRAKKEWETAMRILSKVINEDVVSRMRLKAMYLRAELYEEQDRKELAQRQLEALAKKGGDWALQAKEKLKKDYGY